ncbi:MAG: 16S rRNA (guanine(966)-N(2))-methyltransferase RsmD [Bacteroidales bacterium]|nr:16S rRNA (guanine(966)-N(2))-methyltransferase RsmD [Bacteroidales bacterium]MCF8337028.1 16S rRNA (guanine(966)-N(2))-methyltransferase RsmD [Bacteroidales bacterium]
MRIISGKYDYIQLRPPKSLPVRPTTDKTKESVFNVLKSYLAFEESEALDLFAGTGNMAFEFLSRGCPQVTAVEKDSKAVSFMRDTAKRYGVEELKVVKTDVFHFLEDTKVSFDVIFADPPYDMEGLRSIPELIFENGVLKDNGWLMIEHSKHHVLSDMDYFDEERKYGRTRISIFRK